MTTSLSIAAYPAAPSPRGRGAAERAEVVVSGLLFKGCPPSGAGPGPGARQGRQGSWPGDLAGGHIPGAEASKSECGRFSGPRSAGRAGQGLESRPPGVARNSVKTWTVRRPPEAASWRARGGVCRRPPVSLGRGGHLLRVWKEKGRPPFAWQPAGGVIYRLPWRVSLILRFGHLIEVTANGKINVLIINRHALAPETLSVFHQLKLIGPGFHIPYT